jgi:hypothetical protein
VKKFFNIIWSYIVVFFRNLYNLILKYPLATALTILLIVVAVAMLISGKTFQIGGLLSKLWDSKKPSARGIPPSDRKNPDGTMIPLGMSDDKGYVQAPVATTIVEPGIFSNPDTIQIIHPDKGTVTVQLPNGVKNKDVQEVIEVSPDIYEVRNHDTGVNPDNVLDILKGKK